MSVETPKKIVDETSKCFTCSSQCPGKERVYIFGKTALEQSNRSVFQSKSLDSQKTGKKDLEKFDIGDVSKEWRERAPFFYSFLLTPAANKNTKNST